MRVAHLGAVRRASPESSGREPRSGESVLPSALHWGTVSSRTCGNCPAQCLAALAPPGTRPVSGALATPGCGRRDPPEPLGASSVSRFPAWHSPRAGPCRPDPASWRLCREPRAAAGGDHRAPQQAHRAAPTHRGRPLRRLLCGAGPASFPALGRSPPALGRSPPAICLTCSRGRRDQRGGGGTGLGEAPRTGGRTDGHAAVPAPPRAPARPRGRGREAPRGAAIPSPTGRGAAGDRPAAGAHLHAHRPTPRGPVPYALASPV